MQRDERKERVDTKFPAQLRNVISFYFFIKLPQKQQTVLIITVYSNEWNTGQRKMKVLLEKNLIRKRKFSIKRGIF